MARFAQAVYISLLSLSISGCAQMFTAKTHVKYVFVKPDGSRIEAEYSSDKDQSGFSAKLNVDGTAEVNTDKANTPEAVMRATAESLSKISDMLGQLMAVAIKVAAPAAPIAVPKATVP